MNLKTYEAGVRSGLFDRWTVAAIILACGYFAAGIFALEVTILNHFGGLGSSVMDGSDSLGISNIWELQANLPESKTFMQLMMWGFYPVGSFCKAFWGDTWQALHMELVFSVIAVVVGAGLVFAYAREILQDSLSAFLLMVVYFLLPAAFANSVYWYGQPPFVMLMASLYLMRRGHTVVAALFVIWALGCHPMSVPAFLGMAWMAFRAPLNGVLPLLPGLERRDAIANRNWWISFVLCALLAVWTAVLVIGSKSGEAVSQRGLLWDFFIGKFQSGTLLSNAIQVFFFFLPMLFLPLVNKAWLPALAVAVVYCLLGSQGVVTGFSLPLAGFAMVAMAHQMQRWTVTTRHRVAFASIATAVAVNLFVPWSSLFPLTVEPLTGGLLAPNSWVVHPQEAAINRLVAEKIPVGTPACLTTWQMGPVMSERCQKVSTLSFPFRRQPYQLVDFLEVGDHGRLTAGQWNFVLIDLRRERNEAGLDQLIKRITDAGVWEVAGKTDEVVLYRRINQAVQSNVVSLK